MPIKESEPAVKTTGCYLDCLLTQLGEACSMWNVGYKYSFGGDISNQPGAISSSVEDFL